MCNAKYNQLWKVEGSHDYSHMLLVMSNHHKPNNIMDFLVPLILVSYQTIPSRGKTDTLQTAQVTESVPNLGSGRKDWIDSY